MALSQGNKPIPTYRVGDTLYNGGEYKIYLCKGDTITIKVIDVENKIDKWVHYLWTFPQQDTVSKYEGTELIVLIDNIGEYVFQSNAYWADPSLGITTSGIYFNVSYCPPTAAFTVTDSVVCQNTCISATDKSTRKPTIWAWDMPGATPNTYSGHAPPPICFADTGMHTISLIATNPGGSDTATQNIYVHPAPLPKYVQTEFTIPYGDSLTLQACASGQQYTWQACPNCDSTYTLTPTTKNTTVTGTVRTLPSCDVACTYTILTTGVPEEVMIPTAFSPNGDGINDGFGIAELSPYRKLNTFSIYNRWGELVYTTKVQDDRWDGIYKGMPQPLGTYVWYIDMTNTLTGSRKTLQGNVTLVR
jgi:gliding motility-associated-like protein